MSSLLPPSIRDERFLRLEQIVERLQAIDLQAMAVYDIDDVTAEALFDLADQFNVLGLRGWSLADTVALRRALIKEAIVLHRKAGTGYAVRRAMALVGYPNSTITENPNMVYDGSWSYNGDERYEGKRIFGFVVTLDPAQAVVTPTKIALVIALINEWKNARSKLLDLRIGNVSLFQNLLQYDGSWRYNAVQEYDGVKNLLIHEDNFSSAAPETLAVHVPDFAQPGFAYVNGSQGLCSGGILTITGTGEIRLPTADVTDYDVTFSVLVPTGATFVLLLRRNPAVTQDVRVQFAAAGQLQLRESNGGPSTVLATAAGYTFPANTWLTARVILVNSNFSVSIGGVERVSSNTAPTFPHAFISFLGQNSQLDYISIRERLP